MDFEDDLAWPQIGHRAGSYLPFLILLPRGLLCDYGVLVDGGGGLAGVWGGGGRREEKTNYIFMGIRSSFFKNVFT